VERIILLVQYSIKTETTGWVHIEMWGLGILPDQETDGSLDFTPPGLLYLCILGEFLPNGL
jgi:hypothetical protein